MVYCNAGHNPPLVIGSGGVRRLERGGPIVGLFEGATYEEERLRLTPGDWLIIFSDGISEAMSATGDEYGEARIIDCVQAQHGAGPAAPARSAVRRRPRLHARRAAERRHHRDGAALRAVMTRPAPGGGRSACGSCMAVVVWNGLYDLRITLGVRDHLMKQALHDAGRGPAVTIVGGHGRDGQGRGHGRVAVGVDHPRRRPGTVAMLSRARA